MKYQQKYYPETEFGGFTDIDGTITFFTRVNSLLKPSFSVLDVGCGRGRYSEDPVPLRRVLRILKGKVAKVIGIDIDKNACNNPFLDEFYFIQGDSWPIENEAIDLILCDNVLEHIDNPERFFFPEAYRVLKNGGYLCIRTPNRWSYIGLFTRFIPHKYHSKVVSIVQNGRQEEDVFPTFHACNSTRKIKNMMKKYGFECVVYEYEAEPSYLSFSRVAYSIGVLHQRFAPGFLKSAIFAFGRIKKDIL